MRSNLILASVLVLATGGMAEAIAQAPSSRALEAKDGTTNASDTSPMAEGEVRRVDKSTAKITIKHGPIKTDTVDMDPMTMVFQVRDKAALDSLKAGDRIRFRVISDADGRMTVTEIKPAQ